MSPQVPAIVSSTSAYKGRVLEVRVEQLRRADGSEMSREVVVHPDCVAVGAFLPDGKLVVLRQYRHPVGRFIFEVPAGKIDPGEEPLQAVKRELEEECGLVSDSWKAVGSYYSSPGFTTERMHIFLAQGCVPSGSNHAEADIASWEGWSLAEAQAAVGDGRLCCAKSLLVLAACGWLPAP